MIRDSIQSLHSRWANVHPFVRFTMATSLIILLGSATIRPTYRLFKEWRMDRNLAAAERAVTEQRMQEALDRSLTVLRGGTPDIEAFRIFEKSSAALGDPRHHEIARALLSHPDGTYADRLTGFQALVMDIPLGQVGSAWSSLPESTRVQPDFALAFARRLIAEKRLGEAAQVLLAVPKDAQITPIHQNLARIYIAADSKEGVHEALKLIATGIANDPDNTATWIDVVEEIPMARLSHASLGSVIDSLANRSLPEDPSRLALIRTRLALATATPEERERIAVQAIQEASGSAAVHLARLLTDLGMNDLLLETFPPGAATSPLDLSVVRFLWLAAQRSASWDKATRLLDAQGSYLPKHEEAAYRAIIAHHHGTPQDSMTAWRNAMEAAKSSASPSHALLDLHRMTSEAGLSGFAESAMLEAIRTGSGPLPLYEAQRPLILSLAKSGQERAILDICGIYLAIEPANPKLLTQYSYLACIHDIVDPARLLPPLESIARVFPEELPVHITLAIALLTANRPADAAKVLEPFQLAEVELSASFRIVHLACEVQNGRLSPDADAITQFPWGSLMPTESRKFKSLIQTPR